MKILVNTVALRNQMIISESAMEKDTSNETRKFEKNNIVT